MTRCQNFLTFLRLKSGFDLKQFNRKRPHRFVWAWGAGSKGCMCAVTVTMFVATVTMWAVTASVWHVTATMGAVTASMSAAQALCWMLQPLHGLL